VLTFRLMFKSPPTSMLIDELCYERLRFYLGCLMNDFERTVCSNCCCIFEIHYDDFISLIYDKVNSDPYHHGCIYVGYYSGYRFALNERMKLDLKRGLLSRNLKFLKECIVISRRWKKTTQEDILRSELSMTVKNWGLRKLVELQTRRITNSLNGLTRRIRTCRTD